MRLARGLTRQYKPLKLGLRELKVDAASSFTDCPYIALELARGAKGVVLVIDGPPQSEELVHEAICLRTNAKRFIVDGSFDDFVVATLPAKDLRAEVKRMAMSKFSVTDASLLRRQLAWTPTVAAALRKTP